MNESEFYTVRQASELLGVKRRTLSYWVKQGDVKAYKSRFGYWLIPTTEIAKLGEQLRNKTKEIKQ
jgi:excisionase family DNA binding protein